MLNTTPPKTLTDIRKHLDNVNYIIKNKAYKDYKKQLSSRQLINKMSAIFPTLSQDKKIQLLTEAIKAGADTLFKELIQQLKPDELQQFLHLPLDNNGNKALHLAARAILGNPNCIYQHYMQPPITEENLKKYAAILEEWNKPFKNIIQLLIKKGASINELNGNGQTPLIEAVIIVKSLGMLEVLLKLGADITNCNTIGQNVFHLALSDEYSANAIITLLSKHLSAEQLTKLWNQQDSQDKNPFHVLMTKTLDDPLLSADQCQLLNMLLPRTKDSNKRSNPYAIELDLKDMTHGGLLHTLTAVQAPSEKILCFIEAVPYRNLYYRDLYGNTALHQAVLHYAYYTQLLNQVKQQRSETIMALLIKHGVVGGENRFHLRPVDLTQDEKWKQKLLEVENDIKVDLPISLKALKKALAKQKLIHLIAYLSDKLNELKPTQNLDTQKLKDIYKKMKQRFERYGTLYDFLFEDKVQAPQPKEWLLLAQQTLFEEKQASGLLPEIENMIRDLTQILQQQFNQCCINTQFSWQHFFEKITEVMDILRGLKATTLILTQHLYDVFFLQNYLEKFHRLPDKQMHFEAISAEVNKASHQYAKVIQQDDAETKRSLIVLDDLTLHLLTLIQDASPDASLAKAYFLTIMDQWRTGFNEGENQLLQFKEQDTYPYFLKSFHSKRDPISQVTKPASTSMATLLDKEGSSPLHQTRIIQPQELGKGMTEPCRFGYT